MSFTTIGWIEPSSGGVRGGREREREGRREEGRDRRERRRGGRRREEENFVG
jgi:hypothetical protein